MKKSLILLLTIFSIVVFTSGALLAQDKKTFDNKEEFEEAKKAQEVETNAKQAINDGNSLYKSKKYNEAIAKYKESLGYIPNAAKPYYGMGLCHKKMKSNSKAIESFKKVISIDNTYYRAYYALGNLYRSMKKYSEALNAYQGGVQVNPKYAGFYYQIGFVYYKMGSKSKAITNYKKSIELKNGDARVYKNLARAYFDIRKFSLAIEASKNAVKYVKRRRRKDNDKPYWIMGESYFKLKQYDNAIDAYRNSVKVSKDIFFKGASNFGLGECYKVKGNKVTAKKHYREAMKSPSWRAKAEYELKKL